MDLFLIAVLSLLLVSLVALTTGPLRVVLGLLFVLFLPGYTLIAALFPKKEDLDIIERLALSFGLSIAITPLIGLGLNYTPWGIRLWPIVLSLLLFIVVMVALAWYRRRKLRPEERFEPRLLPQFSVLFRAWGAQTWWDRVLTAVLALSIAGAIGALIYVIATPKVGERFTEFYILGPEGQAAGYPSELVVGQEARVVLGIIDQEQEAAQYRVVVTIEEETVGEVGPIVLNHGEKWEQEIAFAPRRVGQEQKVEFLLYKGAATEVYRTLDLWIDVKEATPDQLPPEKRTGE